MAKSLEELIAQIQKNQQAYTPLTQQQMQEQATNRYKAVYDQKKLTAQQTYDTSDQALAQQLAGLQATYDKQREQSRENTALTYSAADRQALSRGMQRSSYNNATLANINLKGNEELQSISDTQAAQEKNIGEQRTLLACCFAVRRTVSVGILCSNCNYLFFEKCINLASMSSWVDASVYNLAFTQILIFGRFDFFYLCNEIASCINFFICFLHN